MFGGCGSIEQPHGGVEGDVLWAEGVVVVGIIGVFSGTKEEKTSNNQHVSKDGCMRKRALHKRLVGMTEKLDRDGFDFVGRGILLGVTSGDELEVPVHLMVLIVARI